MIVLKQENLVMFDVDSTLVMHEKPTSIYMPVPPPGTTQYVLNDNLNIDKFIEVEDPLDISVKILVKRNEPMIRLLQEEHHRGSFVVVWSRGGYEWALNVIKALEFDKWDNLMIMSKPSAYFDDKPVEEWLPYRVYIGPNEVYKNYKK